MTMTGMPAATASLTGPPSAAASGIETTRPSGFDAAAASIICAIFDHVEGLGREILGVDAERLGGVVHAVLDHRPVGVAALAVGDEDDPGLGRGRAGEANGNRQSERQLLVKFIASLSCLRAFACS